MKYFELRELTKENQVELRLVLSSMSVNELVETLKSASDYLKSIDVKDPQNMKSFAAIMELLADEFESRFEQEWGQSE